MNEHATDGKTIIEVLGFAVMAAVAVYLIVVERIRRAIA